ncbi:MAG: DUF4279 domain-containing protein [Methylobacterium frigidaeris]
MSPVDRSTATLRILGHELDPDEITRLLGTAPSGSARRGDPIITSFGRIYTAQTGRWALRAAERVPGNLDAQVREIFAGTTGDPVVWQRLSHRFECRVVCGLFLRRSNEGIEIAPDTLRMLGTRHLQLDLDVHTAGSREDPDDDATRH